VVSPPQKSNLISCDPLSHISDIKLIRTDTTLDLSQKAEKGMSWKDGSLLLLYLTSTHLLSTTSDVGLNLNNNLGLTGSCTHGMTNRPISKQRIRDLSFQQGQI